MIAPDVLQRSRIATVDKPLISGQAVVNIGGG